MPSVPSSNPHRNRTIRDCALDRMLITMRCSGCHRTAHYWAEDLVLAVGPLHPAHVPPWGCARCRSGEWMSMRWRIPAASEIAQGLTVRRPVRKIEKWIWRDERV